MIHSTSRRKSAVSLIASAGTSITQAPASPLLVSLRSVSRGLADPREREAFAQSR